MNLKKIMMVPMLALSLFAVGCGADCESVCEDAKDCDNASDEAKDVDCAKTCEDGQKAAEKAGCEEEWDDLWSCAGGEDVCEEDNDACDSEVEAYGKCIAG